MGSSRGALVTIQYTAENAHQVANLIIVDVEPSFQRDETDLFPRPANYANTAEVAAAEAERNPNASTAMIAMMSTRGYASGPDGKLVPKHDPYFFERWPFRSDDHWDRLETIRAKTLLLHAADSFVRGDVMDEMTARFGDARLVEITDSGHTAPVEYPVDLVAEAAHFLTR